MQIEKITCLKQNFNILNETAEIANFHFLPYKSMETSSYHSNQSSWTKTTRIGNKQGLLDNPRKAKVSKKTDFQLFMMQTINEPPIRADQLLPQFLLEPFDTLASQYRHIGHVHEEILF